MIAQICNSHGFHNSWISTPYHHEIFREIISQVEEEYSGNCIVIDSTWLPIISDIDDFSNMYPTISFYDVDHIFFVSLVDPSSWHPDAKQEIMNWSHAKKQHDIIVNSQFSFWGYYAQHEFLQYRDIDLPWTGDKLFLSYNRKPYTHRIKLHKELEMCDKLRHGIFTLGNDDPSKAITIDENEDIDNNNIGGDVGVPNNIESLGNHNIWQQALINVVTETITYEHFLSEKIWKPIVGKRPFMVIGPPGTIQRLQDWGFKTFDRWWSEGYNLVTYEEKHRLNEELSINLVATILTALSQKSQEELKQMYHEMKEVLEHNHRHFFNVFLEQNKNRISTIIQDEK